jgi:hypothetical protein
MAKLTVFSPTILATPTFHSIQPQRQDFPNQPTHEIFPF